MKCLVNQIGMLGVNCYFVYDESTGECAIIDPGEKPLYLIKELEIRELTPTAILLTHAHFDHTSAVMPLKEKFGIPVCAHEAEEELLTNGRKNMSSVHTSRTIAIAPDVLLKDNEFYSPFKSGAGFLTIHTPGHTKGGATYFQKELNTLFTGDTLFQLSIGRTDFYSGDYKQIISSIKDKLLLYPDDTLVYPGHGDPSEIGYERMRNPYVRA